MAHLHARKQLSTEHAQTVGQKLLTGVRTAGEVAGAVRTAYEVGKGIYSVGRLIAPIVATLI